MTSSADQAHTFPVLYGETQWRVGSRLTIQYTHENCRDVVMDLWRWSKLLLYTDQTPAVADKAALVRIINVHFLWGSAQVPPVHMWRAWCAVL